MVLECEQCSALVDARELKDYHFEDPSGDRYRFSFLKCPRCEGPLLAIQEVDFNGDLGAPRRLYPTQDEVLSSTLPAPIRAAFDEASTCFRSKAYTATAIMCRKALEGICATHGAAQGNLAQSLKKLRDDGVIDTRLFEWADALRLFGNDAAHDVNVNISAPDARDILDFTRALVEYVFTFRERFEEFKKRRLPKAT